MPMKAQEICDLIEKGFPDARVELEDWQGDQDHYKATVISKSFAGKTRVQQHQMVYKTLGEHMGGALHALSLTTRVEE